MTASTERALVAILEDLADAGASSALEPDTAAIGERRAAVERAMRAIKFALKAERAEQAERAETVEVAS